MPRSPIGIEVSFGRTSRLKRFLSIARYRGASRRRSHRGCIRGGAAAKAAASVMARPSTRRVRAWSGYPIEDARFEPADPATTKPDHAGEPPNRGHPRQKPGRTARQSRDVMIGEYFVPDRGGFIDPSRNRDRRAQSVSTELGDERGIHGRPSLWFRSPGAKLSRIASLRQAVEEGSPWGAEKPAKLGGWFRRTRESATDRA